MLQMLTARPGHFARIAAACLWAWPLPAAAQDVRLTTDRVRAEMVLAGKPVVIERAQDGEATLTGDYARTARACPPHCITPQQAAPGVATLGELEVIDFLERSVAASTGVLIDSRLPDAFATGAIPGAVNVPYATLQPENPYREEILLALGAVRLAAGGFDFSGALDVALYCDGAWSDQAPRAVRHLVELGYPVGKIRYYRGGMQDWLHLGLTVVKPSVQG